MAMAGSGRGAGGYRPGPRRRAKLSHARSYKWLTPFRDRAGDIPLPSALPPARPEGSSERFCLAGGPSRAQVRARGSRWSRTTRIVFSSGARYRPVIGSHGAHRLGSACRRCQRAGGLIPATGPGSTTRTHARQCGALRPYPPDWPTQTDRST
jgi:hypothetical protein